MAHDFYLVQRLKRSFRADRPEGSPPHALDKLSNVFGYGNLGDYDLDYMGSAEFEWGAIPEAYDRFVKAGKRKRGGITLTEWTYNGHVLDFLYIDKQGEPFEAWVEWAEGRSAPDKYDGSVYEQRPFEGKERPYELMDRLEGKEPHPEFGWRAHIWWALNENVMWAFHEDEHLPRMLESMGRPKAVALRG